MILFVLDRGSIFVKGVFVWMSNSFGRNVRGVFFIQEVPAMNFLPTLDEVRKIAATGKYNVLPVSCEILSDFTTPIETMKILKNISTHCYMLESAQANETWGDIPFLVLIPGWRSPVSAGK